MTFVRRAIGTAAVIGAILLAGVAPASAVTRTQDFQGFGSGFTQQAAISSATTDANAKAFMAGFPSYSCHTTFPPNVIPSGPSTYIAYVYIECTWNFPDPPTGPTGTMVSLYSHKCADVANGSTVDGTQIQLYDCNGTASQSWMIATDGTVRALGKCMEATGGTANHTPIQLHTCSGSAAQQWVRYTGNALRNPASGRCLDALGFQTANGSPLGLWDCNGLSNQNWTIPA